MSKVFKSGETVLFIGDSITDCGRTNHLPPFGAGYMNMFRNMILAKYPELDLHFINKGISGNTLKGLELRWKKDVLNQKPDHLFIMIGINDASLQLDSARDDTIVLNEFEETFRGLINVSQENGIKSIYCLSPFYITKKHTPLLKMTESYIIRIKTLCTDLNLPLIDIHEAFQTVLKKSNADFWSGDSVHPYEHGHMLIATELFKEVGND